MTTANERVADAADMVAVRTPFGSCVGPARAAWVRAGRGERDPQQFRLSALGGLRQMVPGSALVQPLRAVERALDLAGQDCALLWFLLYPAPRLLESQALRGTVHDALIAEILDLLGGPPPVPPPAGPSAGLRALVEPLSKSEIRVLRYLPTHLTASEIATELSVSITTVKTHLRNLYAKLGAHRRAEAVERARALGLLAPPARQRLLRRGTCDPVERTGAAREIVRIVRWLLILAAAIMGPMIAGQSLAVGQCRDE